jgi:serine/threonine protein kinase
MARVLPETFGRYHILRPLGQGGMGSVYLARDTRLDRLVALKVPRPGDEDLAGFEAEQPVPAAQLASHGDIAAWPDRHSPDVLERVVRVLAAHDATR